MSYIVLARKWRPMSFHDLVGQEHVSRTLGNAIEQGRVAHAFLFTGARGVGKTTSARIVAKALNCLHPNADPKAQPVAEPCLKCPACLEIAEGTDIDVREIDGASYTGVDEIRKLQESLPYSPARDRYKIIIIDEVHMLSTNAWNALLKTLEEPPPHVKFVFATTEVHKVPVTILSRVQRFDFKLIPSRLIGERIRTVLAHEQIEADDRAIALVAREAAGSMRDALSILDQGIAYSRQGLVGEELARVLGVAGFPTLHEIAKAVCEGQPGTALQCVDRLTNESCDLAIVSRDLLGLFRDMVVAKLCEESDDLLDLSDEEREGVRTLSDLADPEDLLRLQQGFAQSFDTIARSSTPRSALEMLLVKLALRPPLLPIDGLLARLSALEARIRGRAGAEPTQRPSPTVPPSAGARPQRSAPPPARTPASRSSASPRAPQNAPRTAQSSPKAPPQSPSRDTAVRPTSASLSQPAPSAPPTSRTSSPPREESAASSPSARQELWRTILSKMGEERPDILAVLQHAVPLSINAKQIALAYESGSVLEGRMTSAESVELLQIAASKCLGTKPEVKFSVAAPGEETLAASEKKARQQRHKQAVQQAQEHPSVLEAVEVLGARVKRVDVE